MRPGLYKEVPSPDDQRLSRIQKNLKDAVDVLSADHDVLSVPITTYVVTGAIAAGKSVVAFAGNAGQTLTLPRAQAQGGNVAALVLVLNRSLNSVTIQPTAGDTLNGLLTLALPTEIAVLLASDGDDCWFSILGPGGAGGGGAAELQAEDLRLISLRV